MKSCTITFLPDRETIRVHQGITLLEAAAQAGLSIYSPCQGTGVCRKCRVVLEPYEKEVLACQYYVYEDLTVRIPTENRGGVSQILERGIQGEKTADPRFQKLFFPSSPASTAQLLEQLSSFLDLPVCVHPDACLPESRNGFENGTTAVLTVEEETCLLLCLEPGDTTGCLYGAAADIGTTTVVLYLIDLKNGQICQTVSAANPQIQYGDNVISRIVHAQAPEGLRQLQQSLIVKLNEMLVTLCRKQQISPENLYEITAVGNTTMNHLLLGYPVQSLGQAPYKAYSLTACDAPASKIGLQIHPAGRLYTVENIAGFVGSDTVAAVLAAGMDTLESISLLVDIGTNGEIVLGNKNRLLAASCAAGPALEGARIMYGSRAENGAIQRVLLAEGDIVLDTIGTGSPRSICGSGLIDAAAVMLQTGILDPSGAFAPFQNLREKLSSALFERLIRFENQPAFVLAWKNGTRQPAVLLTQKDIREVQLAKAATSAGIAILLRKMGVKLEEIETLFLAGAFGNYIQKTSAIRIGLLPSISLDKIRFIGNAAGAGAQMILLNRECRRTASRLAQKIEYIELARQPDFQDIYSDSMRFEERR
ncbi:MAG TPA: ASKHA domain-containing protein [Anaerohalosphaeraceae bacterium]|nr:ASKHA domain-containing protein [Anaerohalosphaeraceae bacterium]